MVPNKPGVFQAIPGWRSRMSSTNQQLANLRFLLRNSSIFTLCSVSLFVPFFSHRDRDSSEVSLSFTGINSLNFLFAKFLFRFNRLKYGHTELLAILKCEISAAFGIYLLWFTFLVQNQIYQRHAVLWGIGQFGDIKAGKNISCYCNMKHIFK